MDRIGVVFHVDVMTTESDHDRVPQVGVAGIVFIHGIIFTRDMLLCNAGSRQI